MEDHYSIMLYHIAYFSSPVKAITLNDKSIPSEKGRKYGDYLSIPLARKLKDDVDYSGEGL